MKFRRILLGVSVFSASAFLGYLASEVLGMESILGFSMGSFVAFFGGIIFYSGIRRS